MLFEQWDAAGPPQTGLSKGRVLSEAKIVQNLFHLVASGNFTSQLLPAWQIGATELENAAGLQP